ncbi:folate-binding protein [Acuticoccus sp. MNP-M23]|uniref:CAF17-like 4Fe-4S cluster assembly/insertion protein YgfZ n=1 Tax=Acuticoccus sp. MNP-M23 TaxID=3072793 RepID=UPI002815A34A|nr:folate-binding protein [Acuticoccus sp. MNP-M23]WMS42524.1 folate-binding protein [Acuticoccus sp. MNP-M23]
MISALPGRSVISVSGADSARFLDGLLTVQVESLEDGALAYGALLSPQGKILTDMMVFRRGNGFALDVPAEAADDLVRRLTMYKLRAAVDVALTGEHVAISADEGIADPRGSNLLNRLLTADAAPQGDALSAYTRARISAGVPDAVIDFPLGDAFPHDANMDLTGGVDFHKGCFVGQEVVSRMRHRGTARRRTVLVSGKAPLPAPGTALTLDGRAVGRMGVSDGDSGLALIRIDRTDGTAEADGRALSLAPPPGAPFVLGRTAGSDEA